MAGDGPDPDDHMPHSPPARIETARLVLRPWSADDAPALQRVVLAHLGHLGPWMPWATPEAHADLGEIADRLRGFGDDFAAGREWSWVLTARDDGRLLGAVGLHPRGDARSLEIGYWIRADAAGQGLVTEAAGAVADAAFATCDVDWLEIRCDPRNTKSWAVARRLGFTHVDTLHADTPFPGSEPRDTMVWRRDA